MWFDGLECQRYDPYNPWYVRISNRPGIHAKGGGTSGKVNYPNHMKYFQKAILYNSTDATAELDGDTPNHSILDAFNSAYGNSPWSGESAYDPDVPIAAMISAIGDFDTLVGAVDYETDWENMVDVATAKVDAVVVPESYITAAVSAFSDNMSDNLDNNILPRFKAGMADINAVMTSGFVIGQSIIEGMAGRDVAKFNADLSLQISSERSKLIADATKTMAQLYGVRIDGEKGVVTTTIEANRMKIAAKQSEIDSNLEYDVRDALWDLELFKYPGNLLASIGGGTAVNTTEGPAKGQMAMAGALGGAMIGASVGGPVPALIGGVIGGIGGLLAG